MAQNSLLMTATMSRKPDKVLGHQETDHAHFCRKIRISTRKGIAFLSFLSFLTTSDIKSDLQVVICGFQHLSCTKLSGNADDKDCDPEFNSLLNRKSGKKH